MQRAILLFLALSSLAGCVQQDMNQADTLTIDLSSGCPALRSVRCGESVEIVGLDLTANETTEPVVRVVGLDRPLEIRDVRLTGGTLLEVQGQPGCTACHVSIRDATLTVLAGSATKAGIRLTHTTGLDLERVDGSWPGGGVGQIQGLFRITGGAPAFVSINNGTASLDWKDVRVVAREPNTVDAVWAYGVPTQLSWSNVTLIGFAGAGTVTGQRADLRDVHIDCMGQGHGEGWISYEAVRVIENVEIDRCWNQGISFYEGTTEARSLTVNGSIDCIRVKADDVMLRDVDVSSCARYGIHVMQATIGIEGGRVADTGFSWQPGQRLDQTGGLVLLYSSGFVHRVSFLDNLPFAAAYLTGNIWTNELNGYVLDATENYWGPRGPVPFTDKLAHEAGLLLPGNHVQDEIRFAPWLTSPP